MNDDLLNAFCKGDDVTIEGSGVGPLADLRFAAKDLLDVEGFVTGAGNPDWLRTHRPAERTAPVIAKLLDAGASLEGKTVTAELAFSLVGVNAHYGTPINPAAPDSVPGGSSSGSASAVGGHLVDFALGTDTGGSVRVPAALCGLYGFRPTHGLVSIEATFPMAPSFDTVGWLTRDSLLLWQIGRVLLPEAAPDAPHFSRLILADDVWDSADEAVVDALFPEVERLFVRFAVENVVELAPDGLAAWSECFRVLQGSEMWAEHRDWLESVNPTLALDIRNRIESFRLITEDDVTRARAARDQITSLLLELLGRDGFLAIPTTPEISPLLSSTDEEFAEFRRRTLQLTCIASLAGLPQVTVPVAYLEEYPVGLSLVGAPGTDHQLIALAATIARPAI